MDQSLAAALTKRVDHVDVYLSAVSLTRDEHSLVHMEAKTKQALINMVKKVR